MKLLEGKAGLVTGGGMGIGRAICISYASEGAKVAVADFNSEAGLETVSLIKKMGGTAVYIDADVSDDQTHGRGPDHGRAAGEFQRVDANLTQPPECLA